MTDKPDLQSAYALDGADANRELYARWAQSYDTDFARENAYLSPLHAAQAFKDAGGAGPVVDLGAGTGLVGEALQTLGVGPVDACDLSVEMLRVAQEKNVYRRCFPGDMLARLPIEDETYQGAVSAGTFTHGHVGPEALTEVLRIVRPKGLIVLTINAEHWEARGFRDEFERLESRISGLSLPRKRIYGKRATGDHATDETIIATFRKGN